MSDMISIIIPTLNEEKTIEATLTPLKKLTSVDYEIIVTDTNSSDKTVEIAKRFADVVLDNKIDTPQTIARNRNIGASHAKGEYFAFIDADVSIPNINAFFAEVSEEFRKDPNLVALSVFIKVLPEVATVMDNLVHFFLNWTFYIWNNYLHNGVAAAKFIIIKKSSFDSVRGFNDRLVAAEDVDLFKRLSRIGDTKILSDLCVYHNARRAHRMGWPKLLGLWAMNAIYTKFLKHSFSHEWAGPR